MNTPESADFAAVVIGKGLMGAAAARYLSRLTPGVAVVGPDEPANPATHPGVFASHYDEGRLTRRLSRDAIWSALTAAAMAAYPQLEALSGISFHRPAGSLLVAPRGDAQLAAMAQLGRDAGILTTAYAGTAAIHAAHPDYRFPPDQAGILEAAPAGHVNPRAMLRAQLAVAQRQGAVVVRETAVSITPGADHLLVTTDAGRRLRAARVLVAAGAFSNGHALLPRPLALRVKTETIVLGRLPDAALHTPAGRRWQAAPTLSFAIDSPDLADIYLVPPLPYPDGRFYVKMGANTRADQWPETPAEMRAWMQRGNGDAMLPPLRAALRELMPTLPFDQFETRRCLVTYTPHGRPMVDQIDERLFVAAGGNGAAAKCADTLGRMAAELLHAGRWSPPVDRHAFRAVWAS